MQTLKQTAIDLLLLVAVAAFLSPFIRRAASDTPVASLPGTCTVGDHVYNLADGKNYWCTAVNTWTAHGVSGSSGGVPSGAIIFVDSGSCPAGYTEESALSGQMLRGTVAANADVGTTGGSNSITPAGSVGAPTFTGSTGTVPAETISWPASVPAFTGTAGTTGTATFTATGTKMTTSGSGTASVTNIGGTTITTASQNVGSHSHSFTPAGTIAWPASVPANSTASFTPAGTVSAPAFTGTAFDPHPAFTKVIFCKAP